MIEKDRVVIIRSYYYLCRINNIIDPSVAKFCEPNKIKEFYWNESSEWPANNHRRWYSIIRLTLTSWHGDALEETKNYLCKL